MFRLLPLLLLAACLGTPSPLSPKEEAESATYYMLTPDGGQCTAWGVDAHLVITAGHCCDEQGDYRLLTGYRTIIGSVVRYVDDDDANPPKDACLIRTATPVNYLPLAAAMPSAGDYVQFVGFPGGKRVHSEGKYLGDVDGPLSGWNDHQTTAPCDRGASGSAMLNAAGEAWGILVRLHFTGDRVYPGSFGCVASPLSQIHEVLNPLGV